MAECPDKQQNKALHPTAYSVAVSLVPRFTLALPAAGELGRSTAARSLCQTPTMESQLEKANKIIQTSRTHGYSDGERIVNILLDGRSQNDLNVSELRALARGYNWWGQSDKAYDAINAALEKQSQNFEFDLLVESIVYIQNAHYDTNLLPEIYENFIERQIGPSWFWRVQKAWEYELIATGEAELEDYEWQLGNDIIHPEALEQAIDELIKAVEDGDVESKDWVSKHVDEQPALRQSPRFPGLMEQIKTP